MTSHRRTGAGLGNQVIFKQAWRLRKLKNPLKERETGAFFTTMRSTKLTNERRGEGQPIDFFFEENMNFFDFFLWNF